MSYLQIKDRAYSSLTAELLSSVTTTFDVTTGEGSRFPTTNFVVTIEDEQILISSRTNDTFSISERGYGDTVPATHAINKPVELRIIAKHLQEIEEEIDRKITGPGSAVDENIVIYDEISGTVVKDSGKKISDLLSIDQTTQQTVQGYPMFDDGIQFGTTPTEGTFSTGKVFYDNQWRTLTAHINGNVRFQVGQEEFRLVYNNTGSTISNGKAVYTNGVYTSAFPYVATVALARADDYDTAQVLGIATQDILTGNYGIITVRGHINNLNTSSFSDGSVLYLSDTTAGDLVSTKPSSPSLKVRVGRCIYSHTSLGTLNVRILTQARVEDLSDYEGTAVDGDFLAREGNAWVPRSGSVSAGAGVNVYLDNDVSVDDYRSLLTTPDNVTATQTDSVVVNNSTALIRGFLYNQAENRTKWDGGIWKFNIYAYVSSAVGTSEVIVGVHNVQYFGGTATITGTGTSRTCTLSGYTGTPFVSGDANADLTLAGYVQTAGGTFQITGYTSVGVVTISTPSGYVNESGVSYSIHKYKFQTSTGEINQTTTPILYQVSVAQPDITLKDLTDTIAFRFYGKTNSTSNKTLYITYNGTTNYTYIETPLKNRHDELAGLNLTGSNYMHLTTAQHLIATQSASASANGYLTSADWSTFNAKAAANQTMYIGTTAVAINRTSGALTLEGMSFVTPDIGAATADSVKLDHGGWFKSVDNAGTGETNMFRINTNDEIDTGANINIGQITTVNDAGAVVLADMPVTVSSSDGTEMSFTIKVGNTNILKVYAEADGAGGVDTFKVQLLNKAVLTLQDSVGTTFTYTPDAYGNLIVT